MISIVTAVHNQIGMNRLFYETLKRNTRNVYELIIIDNNSTDGSREFFREHADTVIENPGNYSYPYCQNQGIAAARYDYLVFLNAGDVFPSADTLEYVEGCVGEGEVLPGVLYGDTDIVNMDGRFLRHRRLSPPKKLTWRSFIWGMLVCHQSFYARTDIAKSEHYDLDYRFSADVDWCIRMMKASKAHKLPLRNVGAVITNYLDGGMSVQNHKDSLKERFQVMKHHYGLLPTLLAHAWFLIRGVFKK